MSIPKPDLREYMRLEGEKIPESMQIMLIDYGFGDNIPSNVVDFSPKGIRVLVEGSQCKVLPHEIIIMTPEKENFSLVGEVIHIIPGGEDKYYLGILFLATRSLETYQSRLE
ncbi:MAG: hypothetical protein JW904_07585 [Spirochaetales bacterium]|nr:hypothetical protein [Spirochaetales bacterium]